MYLRFTYSNFKFLFMGIVGCSINTPIKIDSGGGGGGFHC